MSSTQPSSSVPQLTEEQLSAARAAAADARRRRAEVKDQVRAGEVSLSQVLALATEDDVVAHIKVVDLLRCLPRVGEVRASAMMETLRIAPNRRLRGLGARQQAKLLQKVDMT